MPKYLIIGLAIPILLFVVMHYWSKFNERKKNRIIMLVFGIITIGFIILVSLLLF